jgi:hypothetical protein
MKIEVDLPDEIVEGLRAKSQARGMSLDAYAAERVREILAEDEAELTVAQRKAIDARLAEGLDDLANGRSHGPFSTHRELMARLEERPKSVKRGKRGTG